jgi:hypothetical protein
MGVLQPALTNFTLASSSQHVDWQSKLVTSPLVRVLLHSVAASQLAFFVVDAAQVYAPHFGLQPAFFWPQKNLKFEYFSKFVEPSTLPLREHCVLSLLKTQAMHPDVESQNSAHAFVDPVFQTKVAAYVRLPRSENFLKLQLVQG